MIVAVRRNKNLHVHVLYIAILKGLKGDKIKNTGNIEIETVNRGGLRQFGPFGNCLKKPPNRYSFHVLFAISVLLQIV